MNWFTAIALSVAALILTILLSAVVHANLAWLLVLGTAAWAAVDSTKLDLKRYKTGIAYGPVVLFFAIALLWIIGFPWYLVVRAQIRRGSLPLKRPDAPSPSPSPIP